LTTSREERSELLKQENSNKQQEKKANLHL